MTEVHSTRGVRFALLGAGPIFVTALAISHPILAGEDGSPWLLLILPPFILVTVVFGAFLATLPVLVSTHFILWLSGRSVKARHPVVWAAIGAMLGLATGLATGCVLPLAATGATCALLVRYGTRWDDDSV